MGNRQTTYDLIGGRRDRLGVFFAPKNVAVIGATDNPASVGRTVLSNLIGSPFGGAVFPVNPKRSSVLGIRAYPNIASVPEPADLAVIVTPARTVPGVISECVAAGVRGAELAAPGNSWRSGFGCGAGRFLHAFDHPELLAPRARPG